MGELAQDFRYALRRLSKQRWKATLAITSLAVSIGWTAATYGAAQWLLDRRHVGVDRADRLVVIQAGDRAKADLGETGLSYPQFEALRVTQDAFEDLAAYGKLPAVLSDDARADQAVLELVTGNYFKVLGMRPSLGRLLEPEDDVRGGPLVCVLSYPLWQRRFGGDRGILDKLVKLNGRPCRVVGITAKGFDGYHLDWNGPTHVWLPIQALHTGLASVSLTSGGPFFRSIGRIRPEISLNVATERAQAWVSRLPPTASTVFTLTTLVLRPGDQMRVGRHVRARLFFAGVLSICVIVLLAASANIANFLVGDIIGRRQELAMRIAIGASRARVFRQLMAEAFVLGGLSAPIAAGISFLFGSLIADFPRIYLNLPLTAESLSTAPSLDHRLVLYSFALSFIATVLFGAFPSWFATYVNLPTVVRTRKPDAHGRRLAIGPRQLIVVLQVALAVTLSVSAVMFLRSFGQISRVRTGYSHESSVLLARVIPTGLTPTQGNAFYDDLLRRLNSTPGVVAASIGWNAPFVVGVTTLSTPGANNGLQAGATAIGARFFETQGIPMLRGREYVAGEYRLRDGLIINQLAADKLWPNADPIGQPIQFGSMPEPTRVIGISGDRHCEDPLAPAGPCVWRAFPRGNSTAYLRLRLDREPTSFAPELRRIVREIEPTVAVAEEIPLDAFIARFGARVRLLAVTSGILAVFGILVLSSGVAAVFVSMIQNSVKDFAIRISLGASYWQLARDILGRSLVLFALGIPLGIVASVVTVKRLSTLFYQTPTLDVGGFAIAIGLLTVVVVGSTAYATRAILLIDPASALKAH